MDASVLICIYNYKHDENARKWLKLLSSHFKTVVLDSGNDRVCEDFVQFPNIYYSGLFNKTEALFAKGNYEWVGIIPSDITMPDEYSCNLVNKIQWLKTTANIGEWQPSLDATSRNWLNNIHTNEFKYEGKQVLEGHFCFIKKDVFAKLPEIDTTENKYGYGISEIISFLSTKLGFYNVFDNTLQMHHPRETQYDAKNAIKESLSWTPKVAQSLNLNYNDMIGIVNNSLGEVYIKYNTITKSTFDNEAFWMICEPATGNSICPEYSTVERLILTMTTWKLRIHNVPVVLQSILDGSMLPDKIIINLAIEEFPNKLKDFPEDTANFIEEHKDLIEINWLKNNTKVWKKIMPTLIKYPNDCTLCIDDDFLYPANFVETFKNMHDKIKCPLFGIIYKQWRNNLQHCGPASLDKLEWMGKYLFTLDINAMQMIGDDDFYTYCIAGNNSHPAYVGQRFHANMKSFNSVCGFSKSEHLNALTINKILDMMASTNFDKTKSTSNYVNNVHSSMPVVKAEKTFFGMSRHRKIEYAAVMPNKVIAIRKEKTQTTMLPPSKPTLVKTSGPIKIAKRLFI